MKDYTDKIDSIFRDLFSTIIGRSLTDNAWSQAQLSKSDGGFGIPNIKFHALAASISSCSLVEEHLTLFSTTNIDCLLQIPWYSSLQDAIKMFNDRCESSQIQPPLSSEFFQNWQDKRSSNGRQRTLSDYLYQCSKYHFNSINFTSTDKARLLSVSSSEAGLFLTAYPRPENVFTSEEFETACCTRLGLDLKCIPSSLKCNCENRPYTGADGNHFHSCSKGGDRHNRHDELVRIFGSLASSAGFKTTREPSGIFHSDNTDSRPDLFIQAFNIGKSSRDTVTDISITHPCTSSNLTKGCHSAEGKAADIRYSDKISRYKTLADNHNFDFIPIVFESFGRWHGAVKGFVEHTCSYISSRRSIPKSAITKFWKQRISVCLARANAAMIISRVLQIAGDSYSPPELEKDSSSEIDLLPTYFDISTR